MGILGGLFASQVLEPYLLEVPFFYKYVTPAPIYINKTEKIVIQENVAIINAVEKVEKTVVGVRTITKKGKVLEGSGLILTSDGLSITLADLVPKGGDFNFYFEGKKLKYQILKRDLKENLALIKLEENNLATASFGNTDKIKLGGRVFLIGVIFEEATTTKESYPKKFTNEGIIKYFSQTLIQTNISEKKAAGTALFDIEGNVLGLNYVAQEREVISIPITNLRKFANL